METPDLTTSRGSPDIMPEEVSAFIAGIYEGYAVCYPSQESGLPHDSYTFSLDLWPDGSVPHKGQAVILSQVFRTGKGWRAAQVTPETRLGGN